VTGRSPLNSRWGLVSIFAAVVVLWVLTSLAKVMFNGLNLGLDYGLYHPDGAFYTFRALLFAGYDKFEAGKIVADWYATHPAKPSAFNPPSLFFENAPTTWDQYYPRLLYPLLSAIFVKFLGVPGMLVVPATTYLTVLLITAFVAVRIGRPSVGLFVVVLITSSTTISRWMYINATDGLLMLFTGLFVLLVFRHTSLRLTHTQLALAILLIILSSLTRFSGLLWISIGLIFLAHRRWKEASCIVLTAILSAIPIFLRPFGNDVLADLNEKSPIEKILLYPLSLARISVYEAGQLFVLDRIFFWTLVVAMMMALLRIRYLPSQFFLASFIGLWVTGSVNGVLGVNFRYQLAAVPFLLWFVVANFPRIEWGVANDKSDSVARAE
jgi:hypothetical protein